jgi:hypothetical protein
VASMLAHFRRSSRAAAIRCYTAVSIGAGACRCALCDLRFPHREGAYPSSSMWVVPAYRTPRAHASTCSGQSRPALGQMAHSV